MSITLGPPPRRVPLRNHIVCISGAGGCAWGMLFFALLIGCGCIEAAVELSGWVRVLAIVGSCVFGLSVLVGALGVRDSLREGLHASRLSRHGKLATARVVDVTYPYQRTFALHLEFVDDAGRTHSAQWNTTSHSLGKPGLYLPILYDPADPTHVIPLDDHPARPDQPTGLADTLWALGFPLLTVVVGVPGLVRLALRALGLR